MATLLVIVSVLSLIGLPLCINDTVAKRHNEPNWFEQLGLF